MKLIVLFFFLFFYCITFGQTVYVPLKDDAAALTSFSQSITEQYNHDVASLSGDNKSYKAEIYKERYDGIMDEFKNKDVISEPFANSYLQSLLNKIIQSNPPLQNLKIRAAFIRDYSPNAASMGEGTILFNIGLFNRLENESQACFVLCHELAHLYLDHNNKSIEKYVSTVHSADFQKQLKEIKRSEFQKQSKVEGLAKTFVFDSRRHTREFEEQADSMGLEFMKNTSFDVRESLTCLALLDTVDKDKYDIKLPLEKIFNSEKYPFQQSWVAEKSSFFSAMAKADDSLHAKEKDSLKTHPDCKKRIENLKPKANEYYKTGMHINLVNDSAFAELKRAFDYEIIEYCFNADKISKSLYYTLQMLQFYPDDIYLVTNTGRCLNKMFAAQKNHTLGLITELASPYNEEKYNSFLKFIDKLHLQDLSSINYYYLLQYNNRFASDKNFSEQQKISATNFNN